jgi:hypothetical protein
MRTHAVRPLSEHHVFAAVLARPEQDQHRGLPTSLVGGKEPAEELRLELVQLPQQVRHPVRLAGRRRSTPASGSRPFIHAACLYAGSRLAGVGHDSSGESSYFNSSVALAGSVSPSP